MSETEINEAELWNPIVAALGLGFFASIAIAVVSFVVFKMFGYNVWRSAANDPVKFIFVIGVISSLILQVTVERFISINKLLAGMSAKSRKWLERIGLWSNTLLLIFAFCSIAFINHFWAHAGFTVAYLLTLLILDATFFAIVHHALKSNENDHKLKVCKIVCKGVLTKVDIGSTLGIIGIFFVSESFSYKSELEKKVNIINEYSSISHNSLPMNLHDKGWDSLLHGKAEGQDLILGLGHISQEMPSLLFGGAVGVQLLLSVIVLFCLLRDWTAKLDGELARANGKT